MKTNLIKKMQENKPFNHQYQNGFIAHVGGILTKMQNGIQYFAINGKWVQT